MTENAKKTLLVLDDCEIVYWGVFMLFSRYFPDVTVRYTDSADDCLNTVKSKSIDLLLMDVNVKYTDTAQLLRLIHVNKPNFRVVIFACDSEAALASYFVSKGAFTFISKSLRTADLVAQFAKVLNYDLAGPNEEESSDSPDKKQNVLDSLTSREFELMNFILKGYTTTDIASILKLQKSTVSTHKARIFQKLKVKNPLELKSLMDVLEI